MEARRRHGATRFRARHSSARAACALSVRRRAFAWHSMRKVEAACAWACTTRASGTASSARGSREARAGTVPVQWEQDAAAKMVGVRRSDGETRVAGALNSAPGAPPFPSSDGIRVGEGPLCPRRWNITREPPFEQLSVPLSLSRSLSLPFPRLPISLYCGPFT